MQFKQQLQPGILIRHYKCFWADIELADGSLYRRVLDYHLDRISNLQKLTRQPGSRKWNIQRKRQLSFDKIIA